MFIYRENSQILEPLTYTSSVLKNHLQEYKMFCFSYQLNMHNHILENNGKRSQ